MASDTGDAAAQLELARLKEEKAAVDSELLNCEQKLHSQESQFLKIREEHSKYVAIGWARGLAGSGGGICNTTVVRPHTCGRTAAANICMPNWFLP